MFLTVYLLIKEVIHRPKTEANNVNSTNFLGDAFQVVYFRYTIDLMYAYTQTS